MCCSSEAGGAVKAAAAPAEEGADGERAGRGASQRRGQPRVLQALRRDAGRLRVRQLAFLHIRDAEVPQTSPFQRWCVFLCLSERLAREREILEERAERRLEIFKNLIDNMSAAGAGPDARAAVGPPSSTRRRCSAFNTNEHKEYAAATFDSCHTSHACKLCFNNIISD